MNFSFKKYYLDGQIKKKNGVGGQLTSVRAEERCTQVLGGEPEGMRRF
jgi:hypothetical protein